ncbi:uncharacterized protein PAC_00167 [Phialocephala subalpina]|uniref:Uncharacterized protein n=1 Tax=Phialocephala subalpina TaxID=576137 RepID=A0A1L7WBX5_9HELO|nr:uncharacterized protein PAC_00167 [Phialocephala subalpina]
MSGSPRASQNPSPTMMDKATLRRVIADMFKELRDLAVSGLEDEVLFFRWTVKVRPPPEYSFVFPEMVVKSDVSGGIPEDSWDDDILEKLYRALANNRIEVEVLGEDMAPIRPTSPISTALGNKKKRPHERLRDQLIEKIETTIGHPIVARTPKPIDPRHDDPLPPNSYRWKFSREYPRFPRTKGGISRWPAEDMRRCHNALENGHLIVINLDLSQEVAGPPTPPRRQHDENNDSILSRNVQDESDEGEVPVDESSETDEDEDILSDAPSNTAEPPYAPYVDADFDEISNTFKEEVEELDGEVQTAHQLMKRLVELHGRMFEDTLHLAVQRHTEEQKWLWKARHARNKDKLRAQIELLHVELETNLQDLEATQLRVSQLEAENKSLGLQLSQMEEDNNAKLAQTMIEAKRKGEDEGRRKTIDDINSSMEKENSSLRRSHLEQVVEIRRESYQQGFDAGKKEAVPASSQAPTPPTASNDQPSTDVEALKRTHEAECQATLEHGRRQGREIAYQELALSSCDRVNILLQNHTELNKNRKIRELKTIQQNWQDVPQRVLPSYMLPERHTPGDKTLYLLAKLSKEVDSTKAGQLLAEEINRRSQGLPVDKNSRIVTNADIQNVLNSVNPPNGRGTTAPSEVSESAQPSQHLAQRLEPYITPRLGLESPSKSQESHAASLQKFFTPALQSWLDSNSVYYFTPGYSTTTKAILNLPPQEFQRMEDMVLQHSKSAGIAGRDYSKATTAELKKLKGYLAGLTLELSCDFSLPRVARFEDVVNIFMAIYAIFLHSNRVLMAQEQQKAKGPEADTTGSTSPMKEVQPNTTKPVSQKRKRSDDEPTPEPPKLGKPNTRQYLPRRMNQARDEENQQIPPVETDGSTIRVDAWPSPEVKSDEEAIQEDNLYDATPPPRAKRKPRRSALI